MGVQRLLLGALASLLDAAVEAARNEQKSRKLRQADLAAGDEFQDFLDLVEIALLNERRNELAGLTGHGREVLFRRPARD